MDKKLMAMRTTQELGRTWCVSGSFQNEAKCGPGSLEVFPQKSGLLIALLLGRLVIDMDAFYASVEELDDPTLKSKPMAVGGLGMICTANYEARKYGIRAAMPGFIGRRLCPELVFAKPNFVSPCFC